MYYVPFILCSATNSILIPVDKREAVAFIGCCTMMLRLFVCCETKPYSSSGRRRDDGTHDVEKKTLGLVVVQGGNTQILALVVFARVRARVIVVATREFNQGVGACSRLDVLQLPFFGIIDHKRYPHSPDYTHDTSGWHPTDYPHGCSHCRTPDPRDNPHRRRRPRPNYSTHSSCPIGTHYRRLPLS